MSDTTLRDCIICEEEGDCIEGICSNCAAEDDLQHYMSATSRLSKKNLKLQEINEDLVNACMNATGAYEALKIAGLDKELPGYDSCLNFLEAALAQAVEEK